MKRCVLEAFLALCLLAAIPLAAHAATPTATPALAAVPSLSLHLYHANPDPFRQTGVYFPYWVSMDCEVEIRIYTVSGEVVKDLPLFSAKQGNNEEFWDGRNNAGQAVVNGVFLYRVLARNSLGEQKQGFRKCARLN